MNTFIPLFFRLYECKANEFCKRTRYRDEASGLTAEEPGFDFGEEKGILLFCRLSGASLRPNHSPIQRVMVVLALYVIRPEPEPHHSPPSSADVKNEFRRIFTLLRLLELAQGNIYVYLKYQEVRGQYYMTEM